MSTRTRYAIRAMMQLAMASGDEPAQLHKIAEEQQLSVKYLEQIVRPLRLAALIVSERGSSGGYRLARPASEITALDIVQAVEGPLAVVDCVGRPSVCRRSSACLARDLWCDVGRAIGRVLAEANLAELARRQRAVRGSRAPTARRRNRPTGA
jgi:Rrf2 family protein